MTNIKISNICSNIKSFYKQIDWAPDKKAAVNVAKTFDKFVNSVL